MNIKELSALQAQRNKQMRIKDLIVIAQKLDPEMPVNMTCFMDHISPSISAQAFVAYTGRGEPMLLIAAYNLPQEKEDDDND